MRQSSDRAPHVEARQLRCATIQNETKLYFHADGELLRKAQHILSSPTFRTHVADLNAQLVIKLANDYLKPIGVTLE